MSKKTKNRSTFGQLLWQQRKKQKMTMRILANTVGVSESYISLLESGDRQQPARELVLKLAHALGARSSNQLADQFLLAAGYYPADKQMYEHHGDTIQGFLGALQQDPGNFQAYSALIFAYIRLGQTEEARQMIQEGLGRFEKTSQLQSLLASLELSKQNFDQAIELQRFALNQHEQQAPQGKSNTNQNTEETRRLQLNLSIMLFLRGLHYQDLWLKHQNAQDQKHAKADYDTAKTILKDLLKNQSDAYILDEYARICFNQAFIGNEKPAQIKAYWQECSESFEAVLRTPDKFSLGRQILTEACVFLALAYTHQKKFDQAEILIHSLEVAINPPIALVYYLKACYHSLKGAHQKNTEQAEAEAQSALEALRSVQRIEAAFTSQALRDPDLAWLRQDHLPEMERIIHAKK